MLPICVPVTHGQTSCGCLSASTNTQITALNTLMLYAHAALTSSSLSCFLSALAPLLYIEDKLRLSPAHSLKDLRCMEIQALSLCTPDWNKLTKMAHLSLCHSVPFGRGQKRSSTDQWLTVGLMVVLMVVFECRFNTGTEVPDSWPWWLVAALHQFSKGWLAEDKFHLVYDGLG